MKRYLEVAVVAAVLATAVTIPALAQGYIAGGGGGIGGGGLGAQLIAMVVTYIIMPLIDGGILYHAATLIAGGHRLLGIVEAACGIILISFHTQIVGMVQI